MKPFQTPAWRKRQIDAKYSRKSRVVTSAVVDMEAVMLKAVSYILTHWESTRVYMEPSLNEMYAVSEHFYRGVVSNAFHACEDERTSMNGKRRLAKGPTGIPRRITNLNQVFNNSRYWQSIMKRSRKLTERLRRQYLKKLKHKFDTVIPMLDRGEITPQEAKQEMMQSWQASKPRVETIFRTETTNYFGRTQVAFFEGDEDIIGFMFDSIRDTARTDICRTRHGLIYRPGTKLLRENTPALHWNCRSHLIALANTAYNRKLIEDSDRDPSKKSVAPLPTGWRK